MLPVKGHSYLRWDKDFTLIERNLSCHDRTNEIENVAKLFESSHTQEKFDVKVIGGNYEL